MPRHSFTAPAFGALTAQGAGYGQAVVTYGTQLHHDPWERIVAGLREQLMFWKSRAQKDEAQLSTLRGIHSACERTADGVAHLHLPPFPAGALTGHAAVPRVGGAHTPIRRP